MNIDLEILNKEISDSGDFNKSNIKDVDIKYLEENIGIDSKYVNEYIGKIPIVDISASQYLIIKTNSKNEADIVLKKLNNYGDTLEDNWDNFLLSQQQLVVNRKIGKKGNYAYLVISENANDIEKLIVK